MGVFSQLKADWSVPPSQGTRLDGLSSGGGGWSTVGGPVSAGKLEQNRGQTVVCWDYRVSTHSVPMLIRWFSEPENWLQGQTLAVTFDGQGSLRVIHLRLVSALIGGGLRYWETEFVDSYRGTRTVILPWIDFMYVRPNGQFDENLSLASYPPGLQQVLGVVFGVTGHGRGDLMIERLSLGAGHPELSPPSWPELSRHSLPPWPGWIPG